MQKLLTLRVRNGDIFLFSLNLSCLEFIEIVILWVYCTIPFGFTLFLALLGIDSHISNCFVCLRITDEGSVPEMRIWSILLI